jgi:hypothetical protein
LTCSTLIIASTYSFINWQWISMGIHVSPIKTNHAVNFPVGPILHCCCLYKRYLICTLSESCAICFMLTLM